MPVQPSGNVNILLADDHPIVRQGLRTVLEGEPGFHVIEEVSDGLATLEALERLQPDVLVVDLMMPGLNGLDVVKRAPQLSPRTRVIVLSMHQNEPYVLEALRSGAVAYVLKTTPTSNLLDAVRAAASGRRYLSPPLTERAIEAYIQTAEDAGAGVDPYSMLTSREREVFHLAAEGKSNADIAEQLFISPRTAETHRTNIMRKLTLHSQVELVNYAARRGIIDQQ